MKLDNAQFLEEIRKLLEKQGRDMICDAGRVNAFLMDLAPENSKERKLVCSVLREGIGSELLGAADKSQEEQDYCIRKCIIQIKNDMWIADEAAELAVNIIAGALGISCNIPASETGSSGSFTSAAAAPGLEPLIKGAFTGGDDALNAALSAHCEIGYKALAANLDLECLVIPESIKIIRSRAFQNCINLETIQLPAGLDGLGSSAFLGCMSLRSITIPQNKKYTVAGGMLINKETRSVIRAQNDASRTECQIPGTIERIEPYAFDRSPAQCIKMPKSLNYIAYNAFFYCMELERFEVDPHNITFSSVEGVLHNRSRRLLIRYPSGNKKENYIVEDEVEEIAEGAFSAAAHLKSITFTNNLKKIGSRAFEKCISIGSLMLPASVEVIGERAFQFCGGLSALILPRSIREIGDFAFFECSSIKALSVPKCVQRIGHAAFRDCSSLEKVVIQSEVSFIGNGAFDGCSPDIEICIKDNPYAETYCQTRGIKFSRM